MIYRAALACLLLAACGPSSRPSGPPPETRFAWVGEHAAEDRALDLEAYRWHLARWESAHGPAPRVALVEFHPAPIQGAYAGLAYPESATIKLMVGPRRDAAATMHELHHLALGGDVPHADPRWPDWDREQFESVEALRSVRAVR